MKRWIVIFALPLAACQGPDRNNETEPDVPLQDSGVPAGSDAIVTDAAGEATERAQAESDRDLAQPQGKAFPLAFQGRWGLTANDCTSTRGDAKGLLTITEDRLRFYESVGTVETLTIVTPTRISAELAFEGEGQSWTRTSEYAVSNDGMTLVRTETGPNEANEPNATYRYGKCG